MKIYFIHYKDRDGNINNYKPVKATNKKTAKEYFKSLDKYQGCVIKSVN